MKPPKILETIHVEYPATGIPERDGTVRMISFDLDIFSKHGELLAVTRDASRRGGGSVSPGCFSITHLPSKLKFGDFRTLKMARVVAEQMKNLEAWKDVENSDNQRALANAYKEAAKKAKVW